MAVPVGHTYAFSFGEAGKCDEYMPPEEFEHCTGGQFNHEYGWGIDVDTSTGDVYVSDPKASRIQKFDQDGNFILTWGFGVKNGANELQVCKAPETCQDGIYGNAPSQMQDPMSLAVDNSGGPNDGDVYVADVNSPCCGGGGVGQNLILKYSGEGQYLGKITGESTPSGHFQALPWHRAVDVDKNGFVWVVDEDRYYEARFMRFSNQANNAYVGGSEVRAQISRYGYPEGDGIFTMAVQPSGEAIYTTDYYALHRFVANGAAEREVMETPASYFGTEIGFNPGNEDLFVGQEGRIQEYRDDPNGPEEIGPSFGEGNFCNSNGIAANPTTGDVYVADECGSNIDVFKARRVPETVTEPASNVLHTTGTINGHIAPDPVDGGPVSECSFEWGLTTTYEHVSTCEPGAPFSNPADVHVDLGGLQQEGTYHYRVVAANSIDEEFGKDRTFTPHAVLDLNTDEASGISSHSATLNGSLEPSGEATEYFFEWGKLVANMNHSTPIATTGAGSGNTAVSAEIEGLEDYAEYHYRISATNGFGTSYGGVQAFRTKASDAPTVSNVQADQITTEGAQFSAVVTPNWGETIFGFEYGESLAYGSQVLGDQILEADEQGHPVSLDVDGLTPGRSYHYRALAINFGGISYGPDQTFTTLDVPEVVSETVTGIGSTEAKLNALVSPSLSPTTVHFEYGASPSYDATTASMGIGGGSSPVDASIAVAGLNPGTTYHFRAVATNAVGTEVGSDQSFKTTADEGEGTPPPRPHCKRGLVRRHGKCVKRRHRRHRRHGKHPKHHRNATRGERRSAR
jgi:hypothetical protein